MPAILTLRLSRLSTFGYNLESVSKWDQLMGQNAQFCLVFLKTQVLLRTVDIFIDDGDRKRTKSTPFGQGLSQTIKMALANFSLRWINSLQQET